MSAKQKIVELFFSSKGRLNRKPFFLRSLVVNFFILFCNFLLTLLFSFIAALTGLAAEMVFLLTNVLLIFIVVPALIANIMLGIRRLHDLNRSGYFVLLAFIPGVNVLLSIYLVFFKGTVGDNQFGPDPLAGFVAQRG